MKNLIFIAVILIASFLNAQNTFQGKVIYKVSLEKPDFSKIEKDSTKSVEVKNMVYKVFKDTKPMEVVLNFVNNESIYELDLINEMAIENDREINLTKIMARDGKYYVNNALKEILHEQNFSGDLFLIKYQPKDWKLYHATKQIGIYTCFKAVTFRKTKDKEGNDDDKIIEAWYTPQIPVNFGPKEYNGLPGLILEVQEGKLNIVASKIELNIKEVPIIEKPKRGKKVTEEEYHKIVFEAGKYLFGKH